jgi:hypothetical protein
MVRRPGAASGQVQTIVECRNDHAALLLFMHEEEIVSDRQTFLHPTGS